MFPSKILEPILARVADYLEQAWAKAVEIAEDQVWLRELDRYDVFDGVAFCFDRLSASSTFNSRKLADIVTEQMSPSTTIKELANISIEDRLLVVSVETLKNRISQLLEAALKKDDSGRLLKEGIALYFSDDLRFQILLRYKASGFVKINDVLTIENPGLLADPLAILDSARTDQELQLAVEAIRASDKTVIMRNVLVHVNRATDPGVFGPSIDTVFFTDWLLTNRFAPQRTTANQEFFEDPMRRAATENLRTSGIRVFEIGSGNGMMLSAFTKNEAQLMSFRAIDVSLGAIESTYRNSYRQRQIHQGWIGDQGTYVVGEFRPRESIEKYDVVVCNPPYIPEYSVGSSSGPHSKATMGTELLSSVVQATRELLAVDGEVLMIISNLSLTALWAALPSDVESTELVKKRVPFRIESAGAVEGSKELQSLLRWGLNRVVNNGRPSYEHEIILYKLTMKDS